MGRGPWVHTSDKLEGLGLDGLIGVGFRNSTHFESIAIARRRAKTKTKVEGRAKGREEGKEDVG